MLGRDLCDVGVGIYASLNEKVSRRFVDGAKFAGLYSRGTINYYNGTQEATRY